MKNVYRTFISKFGNIEKIEILNENFDVIYYSGGWLYLGEISNNPEECIKFRDFLRSYIRPTHLTNVPY